jgi:AbrB family looped-hinge helix DNA binding protein
MKARKVTEADSMGEKNVFISNRINKDGQVTIPEELRKILNVEEGDRFEFQVIDKGKILLSVVKKASLEKIFGSLKVSEDKANIPYEEARDRAIENMILERYKKFSDE